MKLLHINVVKILLILVLFISLTEQKILAAPSVATISKYSGSVYIKKSGGEKKIYAFKNMRLQKGDTIFTSKNSSVTLEIDQYKELILGSNTHLSITTLSKELDKSSKSEFRLWTGNTWTNITKKLDKNSKYEIRTSNTIAGVRGTKFYVSQEEDTTKIFVLEGTVVAETFIVSQKPDGTYDFEKIEKFVEKNHEFTSENSAKSDDEINVKPIELETLDLFILTSFRDSIVESNPELLDTLDKIIDKKKDDAKNNPVKDDIEEKIIPEISYDPVITASVPSNNSNSGTNSSRNLAPTASDLYITGTPKVGSTLTGEYYYNDSENDAEGASLFKWYRGTSIDGLNKIEIPDANAKSYTLTTEDLNHYIFFEVTPIAISGTSTGNPKFFVLDLPIAALDNTPPVGKLLDISQVERNLLFVEFNEALSSETLSMTNPSDLLKDGSISYSNNEVTFPIDVKEIQWLYSGDMSNNPLLKILLENPTSFMFDTDIIVEFKKDTIKDISNNISNDLIIGKCINESYELLPTILGTEYFNESIIRRNDNYFTIHLGSGQGNWVSTLISDTNKINMLYESFYVDSNLNEWNKLKANFSAELIDEKTISITIPQTLDYNITKDQWVSLLIPGELITTGTNSLSLPFTISADLANELSVDVDYSIPEKGSFPGTTKIASLNTSGILEARKWKIKIMDEDNWYHNQVYYDSIIDDTVDYTEGEEINVLPYQVLLLLATDDSGRIKKYAYITLEDEMISIYNPPINNLGFDNTGTIKSIIISNEDLPSFDRLEILTTNESETPSDADLAKYTLDTSSPSNTRIGVHELTVESGATTYNGDTVYYRFIKGAEKSSWIADGIISTSDTPINSSGNAPGNFTISAKDNKVAIKGIIGMKAAVIKNGIMSAPVTMDTEGSFDIYTEYDISNGDTLRVVILNDHGHICAVSETIVTPYGMNNSTYNGFSVLAHLNTVSINNTPDIYNDFTGYHVNIWKNGFLNSSNIEIKNLDDILIQLNTLSSGDVIQVQLIDLNGNSTDLFEEVCVLAAPNVNDITLHYGTDIEEDTITIRNLEVNKFYHLDILPEEGQNPIFTYLHGETNELGTLGPINLISNYSNVVSGTSGSKCRVYLYDEFGNTTLLSELITAE